MKLWVVVTIFIAFAFCLRYFDRVISFRGCPNDSLDSNSNHSKSGNIEKKLVPVEIYRARSETNPPLQKIPRVIYQTNSRNEVPDLMAKSIDLLCERNPSYDYQYFDDSSARNFIAITYPREVLEAYDTLVPGAYKADLFRYCLLYEKGGVYLDTGFHPVGGSQLHPVDTKKLDDIILPNDTFLSAEDNFTGRIYNAFLCVTPKHPILKEAIELAVARISKREYTGSDLGITGPVLLAEAFEKVVDRPVEAYRDYGGGVRLLQHYSNNEFGCESGELLMKNLESIIIPMMNTKYRGYRKDMSWYSNTPRYGVLWKQRKVFKPNAKLV